MRVVHLINRLLGEQDYVLGRQGGNQYADAPLPIFLSTPHGDALDRADILRGILGDPTHLTLWHVRVIDPLGNTFRQRLGTGSRVIFAVKLIAMLQCPVDILHAAAPGIHPQDGAGTFVHIQVQCPFGGFHQRLKGDRQLRGATKQAIHYDFSIARRQDAPQLAPSPITLLGKIPLGGKRRLLAAGQPGHVHIQHLPQRGVLVPIPTAPVAIDGVHRRFHLSDIRGRTSIQRVLHDQLFRAPFTPKSSLQAPIVSHSLVDLDQSVGTGQDRDKAIVQLLNRCVLHYFLINLDLFAHWPKQVQAVRNFNPIAANVAHGENWHVVRCVVDSFMVMGLLWLDGDSLRNGSSPSFWQVHSSEVAIASCRQFGRNLGK